MNQSELSVVLLEHKNWLFGKGGSRADLRGADLRGADLRDAKLPNFQIPQQQRLVVWKKACDGLLVQLEIPALTRRTASLVGNKCRAENARVLKIIGPIGEPRTHALSLHDHSFGYFAGEMVIPTAYNDDIRIECAEGIHFFMMREEAEHY